MRWAASILCLALLAPACDKQKETEEPNEPAPAEVEAAEDAGGETAAADTPADAGSVGVGRPDAGALGRRMDEDEARQAMLSQMAQGPVSIRLRPEWRRCNKAAECTRVFSGCSSDRVVVNRKSEKAVRAAWKKACKGRGGVGILTQAATFTCEGGICRVKPQGSGFKDALDKALEKREGAGPPAEKDSRTKP